MFEIDQTQINSVELLQFVTPEPVFLNLGSLGIDSQEWIPLAYVAWRAGTITLFLLGS